MATCSSISVRILNFCLAEKKVRGCFGNHEHMLNHRAVQGWELWM
jgi:hypothetical protein